MNAVRRIRRSLALFAFIWLVGCSTTPKFSDSKLAGAPVRVDNLYIYSFLDVRQKNYGAEFLRLVRLELDAALTSANIKHVQLWSQDSELSGAALTTNRTIDVFRGASESTYVPVKELVSSNLAQEQQFGAEYRLLIFPSQTNTTGTGYEYTIRWVLMDAKDQRTVWSTTSRLETFVLISANENAEGRAKGFVNGLIAEWRRLGLVSEVGVVKQATR